MDISLPPPFTARRLIHILSPLPKGRPFKPIQEIETEYCNTAWSIQGFCHPFGLFPACKPHMLILAPSVFTRWTTRRLTVRELLECWDVPSCRWEEFETEDVVVPRTFPFLASAPSKVLLGILSSHLPAVPEQPIGQSYFSQPLQQPNLPASESPDIECIDWDMNSLRQRAAKDDDAEVLTHYWDMPFINNLLTLGRPSSFLRQVSQQVVGRSKLPVLDILRQFVLQVWRRSVFLSFQHYMLTTYGSHWFSDKSGDREAGCDCLRRVAGATYRGWHASS